MPGWLQSRLREISTVVNFAPEMAAFEVQRRHVSRHASGGTAPPTNTPARIEQAVSCLVSYPATTITGGVA